MDVAHLHLDKAHLTAMTTMPAGGGHITINLHITGPLDVHDKAFTREIATEIREELIKLGKRNGNIYGQYAGVRTGRTRGA